MVDVNDMEDIGKFDICTPHNFNYKIFEKNMIELLKEICRQYSDKKRLEEIAKKSKGKENIEQELKNKLKSYNSDIEKQNRKLELLYEDRLSEIISVERYIENANRVKNEILDLQSAMNEIEMELKGEQKKQNNDERLDKLVDEFLNMENPTKEIIREFIEKIEIHSDKQVDIYFNFKPLQELNEKLNKCP